MGELTYAVAIGRVFGPVLFVVGVSLLLHHKRARKAAKEMLDSPAMMMVAGPANVGLGTFFLNLHNVWVWSWEVIITVLAWMMVLKGVMYLVLPEILENHGRAFMENDTAYHITAVILGLVGLYLSYVLYLA